MSYVRIKTREVSHGSEHTTVRIVTEEAAKAHAHNNWDGIGPWPRPDGIERELNTGLFVTYTRTDSKPIKGFEPKGLDPEDAGYDLRFVREIDGNFERCEAHEADCLGLYERQTDGTWKHLQDFTIR